MRSISEIIVHCSATPEGKDFTVKDITNWHKERKFRTIGYHYVIYRDGSIHNGRPIEEMGAHCLNHNAHSIGICYIGGMTADMKKEKDTRTPEQKQALITLLKQLKKQFPNATIHGHNEFSNKKCPCFDAFSEYKNIVGMFLLIGASLFLSGCKSTQRVVEEKADSTTVQAASQSVTSSTTDKFLKNLVVNIDSIVITKLSEPQMSSDIDETSIEQAEDNSGRNMTKMVIGGIHLQSTTADSSNQHTEVKSQTSQHSSSHSNVSAREKVKEKPVGKPSPWLLLVFFIAIAVVVATIAIAKKSPLCATVRSFLQKIKP